MISSAMKLVTNAKNVGHSDSKPLEQAGRPVRDRVMEAEDEQGDSEGEDTVAESFQTVRLSLSRILHAQLRRPRMFGPVERSIRSLSQLYPGMYSQPVSKLNDAAVKLLEGKNLLYLGTINRDGTPQITPVWVDTDGTHVLVNTAIGRVKQKNVTRDPRVTLAINTPTDFYDVGLIRGRVVEQVTGPQADKHIDKLAKKYIGKDVYPWRNEKEKRVILKILPERVLSK